MKKLIVGSIAAILLTALSIRYLDLGVAGFILEHTGRHFQLSRRLSAMPDLLLVTVMAGTAICWSGYLLLAIRGIDDGRTFLFRTLGTSLPLAFVLKDVLKWVFGRMNTRAWLVQPDDYAFHWFHGVQSFHGFPSGHMLVFTPIFLALWEFAPRFRPLFLSGWLGLAFALLFTEYHFLGDVIAGGYLGFLVHYGTSRLYRKT